MQKTTIITAVIIILGSISGFGQTVASVSSITNLASLNSVIISQLSYNVMEDVDNLQFQNINYQSADQKLVLETEQDVSFISIYKDGEEYMAKMPVFSSKLNLSMQNYEDGEYELHLIVEGKMTPTIIEISKK